MTASISPGELRTRLTLVPRTDLAALPTPLHDCPRLSAALGGPRILIKREDLTGLALASILEQRNRPCFRSVGDES